MGTRGPVPKRSTERRRRNTENKADKLTATGAVMVPSLPDDTHELARQWYDSLADSGQSQYFEPSDWVAAVLVAEQLTRLLKGTRAINGPAFATIWTAMADLFTTESSRRRARIEVERQIGAKEKAPPGVSAIADFRRKAQGA